MSAAEPVSLLHRLSHALETDGTLRGGHADVLGLLDAITGDATDPAAPSGACLVDAAIALGERRRAGGLDADSVIEDYEALRQAIGRVLRGLPHGRDEDMDALARLDIRTTLALRASLLGHARPRLEAAGRWVEARQELVDEGDRTRAATTLPALGDLPSALRR